MRTFTYHTNFRGVNQNEYVISSRPIETRGLDGYVIISSYPDRGGETEYEPDENGVCADASATCETQHVECEQSDDTLGGEPSEVRIGVTLLTGMPVFQFSTSPLLPSWTLPEDVQMDAAAREGLEHYLDECLKLLNSDVELPKDWELVTVSVCSAACPQQAAIEHRIYFSFEVPLPEYLCTPESTRLQMGVEVNYAKSVCPLLLAVVAERPDEDEYTFTAIMVREDDPDGKQPGLISLVECDDSIRELVFPKRVPQGSDTDVTITEHFSR